MKPGAILAAIVACILALALIPVAGASAPTRVTTQTVAKARNVPRPGTRLAVPAYRQHRVIRVQWLRCNARGVACKTIPGATHRTYTVRLADVGHTLRARVTWQGQTTVTTAPTAQVGRPLPTNTAAPAVTDGGQGGGTLAGPIVGDTLTGSNGTWQHAVRFTYQWEDCTTASPPVCTPISGATTQSYTLQDADVGSTIVFQVTAYNF